MFRRIRHMIIAFLAGILFHKFLAYAVETYKGRTLAPGGEVLFIPLMILLIVMGWEIRGLLYGE
jgi:hypothetical protein